jgi:hypothetical protein
MSNQCPKCGQQAMTGTQKMLVRPHVCQHCGVELRMNLVYTAVVSLLYFGLSVQAFLGGGFTAGSLLKVVIYTLVFTGVCLFIPFEQKKSAQ